MKDEYSIAGTPPGRFQSSKLSLDLTTESNVTDKIVALKEGSTEESVKNENYELNPLVSFVKKKFKKAKDNRLFTETRQLQAYNNYRGLYSSSVQFLEQEKSRVFLKITKTKVHAASAQIQDILFAANKFPIGIEPSPIVQGIAENVHFDPKSPENQPQGAGSPPKSATIARPDILQKVGALKEKLTPVKDMLQEGIGKTPTSFTFEPAKDAAKNMEMLIHDQLLAADASKGVRSFVFDMCLYGTGVFKGPFAIDKEYPKWDSEGKYSPIFNTIADVSHVSVWDAYPDPDARNSEELEYFIQRHRLSRTQLRALKRRPYFRSKSIELAIETGEHYVREWWESAIQDEGIQAEVDRFEVLEYWGVLDTDIAEEIDLKIPKDLKDRDQVQINAWIVNDEIIRVVLNPFTPARIPFYVCPYELNPYSIFGVGIAENMDDTQLIMNGFMRLAIDNATLSSNIIFEVDETNLVPGQDMRLYPGKIFRRQGGASGQSIFATKFPNVTQECLALFDKARQLADEATGMPSYAHGQTGVSGVGRTASGMSMLMGAAKENIKAVVRNIDDYLLVPLGKSMFAFNMQFNFDPKFNGDLEVVARGTESLMRNEVRSQKLLQFLQVTANPMYAPYIKLDYILRDIAASLDLEPDKLVNDPREAGIQAKVMADMAKVMGVPPGGGNPASAPNPSDPTGSGGGNIGPGMAPGPQEAGFTGSGGGANGGTPPQPQAQPQPGAQ